VLVRLVYCNCIHHQSTRILATKILPACADSTATDHHILKEGLILEFSPSIIVFIFLIQFFSFCIKGFLGFGNPLISGPLLSMRLNNTLITPGTTILDVLVNAHIAWTNRRHIQFRRVIPTMIVVIMGSIPGTLLLKRSMPWVIKTALGVVVVILGIEMATRKLRSKAKSKDHPLIRLIVAFFSGVCAGLFGINMFIVAYLQQTAKDYNEFKGSLCFLFLGEGIFRTLSYVLNGMITKEVFLFILISLPAEFLALAFANRFSHKVEESKMYSAAIVLFILGGISIILKSLILHT